ncbi:hypothetical protein T11_7080 [Trichinella zimbabwensis]|uniref:Uncharacterized protein n=1 Tax=Trichinella zimbabwensis TaxID=268475 RepID=A0A0V1HWT2_9BILA|nr:hypothetical protein T11_7080 [Trichinella zimbabwensis]
MTAESWRWLLFIDEQAATVAILKSFNLSLYKQSSAVNKIHHCNEQTTMQAIEYLAGFIRN